MAASSNSSLSGSSVSSDYKLLEETTARSWLGILSRKMSSLHRESERRC
uniref:Chimerin 2 n=1 Tax=Homo sapiens TaxID=9606 RepID=A0A994J5D1_HUMAN